MKKVGRNDPCHCGSGKKYKNCHQQQEVKEKTNNKNLIVGGLVALFVIMFAVIIFLNLQSSGSAGPGEAPAGKVWSEEHGHFHDAE